MASSNRLDRQLNLSYFAVPNENSQKQTIEAEQARLLAGKKRAAVACRPRERSATPKGGRGWGQSVRLRCSSSVRRLRACSSSGPAPSTCTLRLAS